MKKAVLITTALSNTWFHDDDIVFLGEWCKKYASGKLLDNVTHQTVQFHWSDRKKFEGDVVYLEQLHEKLLAALQIFLNDYHRTNYSLRYWRIVVGPWLSLFVPAVFDRWASVHNAMLLNEYEAVTLNDNIPADFTSSDYHDFSHAIQHDTWNYILYSDIIANMPGVPKYKPTSNLRAQSNETHKVVKKFWGQNIIESLDALASKFQPKYHVAFITSYFTPMTRILFALKLRQLPRFYSKFEAEIKCEKIIDDARKSAINVDVSNDFESYISGKLLQFIPFSYFEGFAAYTKHANSISDDVKLIVSSNAHFSNDIFKIWCANRLEFSNCKLILSSHGGSLPSKFSSFQQHEEQVSDIRVVWHKPLSQTQIKLPANKYLGKKQDKRQKKDNTVTVIGVDCGRYVFGAQSGTNSSLMLFEVEQKRKFLTQSILNYKRKVEFYPYPAGAWEIESRFSDTFGSQILSKYTSFQEVLSRSKILICSYPQTTYAEAMLSNTPTVLLYLPEFWTFPSDFDSIIEDLTKAEMLFSDPILAANHVNLIWDNPDDWWDSKLVKKTRKKFFEECVYVSKNGINKWYDFLSQQH